MAGRIAERKGHPHSPGSGDGLVRGDGKVPQAQRGEHALDVEPDAVTDDLDGSTGLAYGRDQVHEGLVERQRIDGLQQDLPIVGQDLHVPGDQLARALAALDVEPIHACHQLLVRNEFGEQPVSHISERDGAVEVHEETDGRTILIELGTWAAVVKERSRA